MSFRTFVLFWCRSYQRLLPLTSVLAVPPSKKKKEEKRKTDRRSKGSPKDISNEKQQRTFSLRTLRSSRWKHHHIHQPKRGRLFCLFFHSTWYTCAVSFPFFDFIYSFFFFFFVSTIFYCCLRVANSSNIPSLWRWASGNTHKKSKRRKQGERRKKKKKGKKNVLHVIKIKGNLTQFFFFPCSYSTRTCFLFCFSVRYFFFFFLIIILTYPSLTREISVTH